MPRWRPSRTRSETSSRSVSEEFCEIDLAAVLDLPGHNDGLFALDAADRRHWLRVFVLLLGVALLPRRPRELLRASRQELLDASKAWWRGRRGRLADRRRCPLSVSLGVIPLVFARFVEVPVRIEVAAGP